MKYLVKGPILRTHASRDHKLLPPIELADVATWHVELLVIEADNADDAVFKAMDQRDFDWFEYVDPDDSALPLYFDWIVIPFAIPYSVIRTGVSVQPSVTLYSADALEVMTKVRPV